MEEVEVVSVGPQEEVEFAVEVVEEVAVPGLEEECGHEVEVAELRVRLEEVVVRLGEVEEERDSAIEDSACLKVEVVELRMKMREVREEVQEKDKRIMIMEEKVAAAGVERVDMVQEMQQKTASGVAALDKALRLLQGKEREVQMLRREGEEKEREVQRLRRRDGGEKCLKASKVVKEVEMEEAKTVFKFVS